MAQINAPALQNLRAAGGLRPHRRFNPAAGTGGGPLRKFPDSIGLGDDNVCFGLGTVTAAGAGSQTLTGNVSREMVLRDLVIAAGSVRGRVTAITAAGDALLQGGSVPVEMFSPSNLKRPEFGIPVYTGTVTVTLTVDAAATIDAGFSID